MAENDDELHKLVARRWRVCGLLTGIMMVAYFGFIALCAFYKETAGTLIFGGRVSVGIVLGAAVIILAPILISIYARWANRSYDPAVKALQDKRDKP